jgi:hypothetical protein
MKRRLHAALPLMKDNNLAADIIEWEMSSLHESNEEEVDQALPTLLKNAGFDPWAIVRLNRRFIDKTLHVHPTALDGYTRMKIIARTDTIEKALLETDKR